MLLLVLILVLIAFGLLLVGYLSASVLWAWVSVAVSIGAAGVLLFDTLQRRSVVRAGDEAVGEPPIDSTEDRTVAVSDPARAAVGSGGGRVDFEPATEVIPVVRPPASFGSGVDPRFDPDADAQQTVMLPAVQPPGSPAGPSGATPAQTPSSESSSPSVTFSKGESPAPEGPTAGDQRTVVTRAAGPDAPAERPSEPEVVADPESSAAPSAPSDPDASVDGPRSAPGAGSGAATGAAAAGTAGAAAAGLPAATGAPVRSEPSDATSTESDTTTDRGDVEATAVVSPPPREEPASTAAAPPVEAPGSLFASRPPANGATPPGEPDPAAGPPPVGVSEPVEEPPAQAPAAQVPAAEGPPAEVPAVEELPEADGEAPEEQSDPQVAAVVAGLEDEVLVIDEQPRYHVTGCRSLAAAALIPLPAREAVELGFTPCGWCTPDHTLASRHRATAR